MASPTTSHWKVYRISRQHPRQTHDHIRGESSGKNCDQSHASSRGKARCNSYGKDRAAQLAGNITARPTAVVIARLATEPNGNKVTGEPPPGTCGVQIKLLHLVPGNKQSNGMGTLHGSITIRRAGATWLAFREHFGNIAAAFAVGVANNVATTGIPVSVCEGLAVTISVEIAKGCLGMARQVPRHVGGPNRGSS